MSVPTDTAKHEEPITVMKFALFLPASWTDKDTVHQSRIYGEVLEQARYAEELGFDSLWIAEHHSSRYGIFPSLMPILSHIAAQTKTIRLGAGVSVLPFHNPIRLAEETAMVDLLSNGRLNLGVGRGSADYEYGNFKIDFDSRDDRFREVLDIILGLWTTEDFTYHGRYYQVDGITIAPRPLQKPHPPVHVAVSRTAASIDIAVARDMPVLTTYFTPVDDTLALMRLYSERCDAAGKVSQMAEMPFFRFIYLSEDEKAANEIPEKAITWVRDLSAYRRTITKGDEIHIDLDQWRKESGEESRSYQSELANNYFCTPDQCSDRIAELQSQHGISYFGANFAFGSMEHAKVMASMKLFAQEVMPKFR
ncbi:MAG TPA: LLM class flavin-dependent oxidoreductase [Dehalococcoidia bacterium]|nr:LLM class flavin-dependent oxidoreductase [Dehalococcoidia bacterium]